jgi:tetratricopeptide (TPR) repeat protein
VEDLVREEIVSRHLLDEAQAHQAAGRLPQAQAAARQFLAGSPNDPAARHLLGLILFQSGRGPEALVEIEKAVAAEPRRWDFLGNYGLILATLGETEKAISVYQQALQLESRSADIWYNLGLALKNQKRPDESIYAFRRAIAFQPNHGNAHNSLGNALALGGDHAAAIAEFEIALRLLPNSADAWFNLGISLSASGKSDDAIAAYQKAVDLHPDFIDAHLNLGRELHFRGQLGQAVQILQSGLALQPQAPMLHWNLSQILLLQGDLKNGWREYQWRTRAPEFQAIVPQFAQPIWDGKPLSGKRILLHSEQGFGDSIHFARYIEYVARAGGEIILAVQPKVYRLFKSIPNVHQLISADKDLPDFVVHCPLPSLPFVLEQFAPVWNGPYLRADSDLKSKFTDLLAQAQGKLKVGLVWCGRARPAGRSIMLNQLAPLAHPGIHFYSLQVGEGREQAQSPPHGMNLIDAADQISDFADLAALTDQLDLTISIDTAAGQLAGALGKRVWTLLKFIPDWRWLMQREDSPWYPTMRLFRQEKDGDWQAPVSRMAWALKELL